MKKIENHKTFLERLRLRVSPEQIEKIDMAYDFAKYGHRNQKRENGERYFEHVRAAALILVDELHIIDHELIIAVLLHDIVEDSYILNYKRIELIFGSRVAQIVQALTKIKNDKGHQKYFRALLNSSLVVKICKCVDRLHNLRTLKNCSPAKQVKKIDETEEYFFPIITSIRMEHPYIGRYLQRQFDVAIFKLK
ncbi:MAG: bifunctional (p)ppGpp synthetase/guanosine-3',5'-bis(diphosphate) 3'-pyrophosphohydrolase [Parcubacteria group bacterium]|nr:bifunctional (p)ppGpp synthetase/guanosine-3',5'-bis(diphosphate) 3'-pyrophosphohydrolase [Parcubacteria group bacterium]